MVGRDFGTPCTAIEPIEHGRVRCEYWHYRDRARATSDPTKRVPNGASGRIARRRPGRGGGESTTGCRALSRTRPPPLRASTAVAGWRKAPAGIGVSCQSIPPTSVSANRRVRTRRQPRPLTSCRTPRNGMTKPMTTRKLKRRSRCLAVDLGDIQTTEATSDGVRKSSIRVSAALTSASNPVVRPHLGSGRFGFRGPRGPALVWWSHPDRLQDGRRMSASVKLDSH